MNSRGAIPWNGNGTLKIFRSDPPIVPQEGFSLRDVISNSEVFAGLDNPSQLF